MYAEEIFEDYNVCIDVHKWTFQLNPLITYGIPYDTLLFVVVPIPERSPFISRIIVLRTEIFETFTIVLSICVTNLGGVLWPDSHNFLL